MEIYSRIEHLTIKKGMHDMKYKAYVMRKDELTEIHIFYDFDQFTEWLSEYDIMCIMDHTESTLIVEVTLKR